MTPTTKRKINNIMKFEFIAIKFYKKSDNFFICMRLSHVMLNFILKLYYHFLKFLQNVWSWKLEEIFNETNKTVECSHKYYAYIWQLAKAHFKTMLSSKHISALRSSWNSFESILGINKIFRMDLKRVKRVNNNIYDIIWLLKWKNYRIFKILR